MNEEMEAVARQAADCLYKQYLTLHRSFVSNYQEKKDMIIPLTIQLNRVKQLKQEIASATHNSQIGTVQCCEALDSVEKKLTAAISHLGQI